MSLIGIHKLKIDNATTDKVITFKVNGVDTKVVTVKVLNFCTGEKYVKFLSRNGFYKYWAFSKFAQKSINPTLIGKTNELITNLLTAQSNQKTVGYKSERIMILTNENISSEYLEYIKDLFVSPCVYLYAGSGADTAQDWLRVEIRSGSQKTNIVKGGTTSIVFDLILPEDYNITKL